MESQPSRRVVIFCGSVGHVMFSNETAKLHVINTVLEMLPLALRTLFYLSSQRDSALTVALRVPRFPNVRPFQPSTGGFVCSCLTSELQNFIKVFSGNANSFWIMI